MPKKSQLDHLKTKKVFLFFGREPCSSGYGRRLMFKRSCVWILVQDTGLTFFTLICCKSFIVCLKRLKIKLKWGLFYNNLFSAIVCSFHYLRKNALNSHSLLRPKWSVEGAIVCLVYKNTWRQLPGKLVKESPSWLSIQSGDFSGFQFGFRIFFTAVFDSYLKPSVPWSA